MGGGFKKKYTTLTSKHRRGATNTQLEEAVNLNAEATSTTTHFDVLLGLQPALQQNNVLQDHELVAQTLEELLQYPDTLGLSTEQIKHTLTANFALRDQIKQEIGEEEYDRRVKAHNERIIEQGKPSYILRNLQFTKNGLKRAVAELSKKGSAQYTIEEEYMVVKTVCLLALRKMEGYCLKTRVVLFT